MHLKKQRNHLISTTEVICLTEHSHPYRKTTMQHTPGFAVLLLLPSAYKSLSFCTAPQSSLLSVRLDAALLESISVLINS